MTLSRRDVELGLDLSTVPRDWYAGDPYVTTLLGALSLLFPEGERFFVESVKRQQHVVTSPALRAEVVAFIGQEAMHGREHRAFNDLYPSAKRVERNLRKLLVGVRKTLSPMSQLAVTTALEHFTARLAEQALESDQIRADLDASVRPLWVWHMLEESEHKTVAYDVYRAAGGGYARRVGIMLLTTAVFFAVTTVVHARLMAEREILWKPWRWLRGIAHMWIWPGHFTRLVPRYLAYFRPGFHPSDRDTTALVAMWRDELFGPAGMLRDQVRAA